MRSLLMMFASIFMLLSAGLYGQDTLILNNGKIITGRIDYNTLNMLGNMQLDLNKTTTLIGNQVVDNKDVKYFIINGVKHFSHRMVGGNKFVEVVVEGKASVYIWSGTTSVAHTTYNSASSPTINNTQYRTYTTTTNKHEMVATLLVINGKTYNTTPKFIKKQFNTFFADCPKLIEQSKAADFDFENVANIASAYNACF